MRLMAVYALIVILGQAGALALGEVVELTFPSASLFVFLGMFFAVMWIGWGIAVRITGG